MVEKTLISVCLDPVKCPAGETSYLNQKICLGPGPNRTGLVSQWDQRTKSLKQILEIEKNTGSGDLDLNVCKASILAGDGLSWLSVTGQICLQRNM